MENDATHQGFNTLATLSHPNHSPISAALSSQNHDIIEAAPDPACVTPPFSSSSSSCNGPSCSTSSASSSTCDHISMDCSNEVSSSPPVRLDKGKVDPTIGFKKAENGGLMRMQGLMKLRRQGSQPPCSLRNKQARELLASLQRLSLKEDTVEAHNSLLLKIELEGSLANNERPTLQVRSKPELPFSAKIAAAMDADGLIGVEKHISDHHNATAIHQSQTQAANHHINSITALHSKVSKNVRRCELTRGAKSGRKRSSIKRRSGWIVLRRLRTSRSLLGKIWKNIKRAFSSSPSKRWLHRELLKDSI